jgi:hypothetical protein
MTIRANAMAKARCVRANTPVDVRRVMEGGPQAAGDLALVEQRVDQQRFEST